MKGVDMFCSSEAATSICLSSTASPSATTLLGGGRIIDRHNPIIKDSKRAPKPTPPTKKTKNSNETKTDTSSLSKLDAIAMVKKSWSCTNPGDFLSPPGSTRYLLREKVCDNTPPDSDPTNLCAQETSNKEDSTPSHSSHQVVVVVLRVSLHCRGCVKKLSKHLSRMEGIKSFDIDFLAKKVTVTGNVTPSDVLSSISKVKNAQLWPPSISSSNPTSQLNTLQNNIAATAQI
ncbi:protein SODIUM POTASSIUM ROOT DEFECTIVE 2-like [Salvia miltiorrhiza]|uniref:protein SODIUM POTASSIUM ROOT DEFECTIVE 2-like n=1 Tax=Salvia miltiorrhiza TaxID=226208 RepID=UPI0025AC305F|nr:protein SODIUM POTASSIUM ROOT DEFECTIVE 2-like [Salvia miltiorrhiza]